MDWGRVATWALGGLVVALVLLGFYAMATGSVGCGLFNDVGGDGC